MSKKRKQARKAFRTISYERETKEDQVKLLSNLSLYDILKMKNILKLFTRDSADFKVHFWT